MVRRRTRRTDESLYFSRLKSLSDEQWRAALAESPESAARWVYAAATYGVIDAQLLWAQMQLDGYGTTHDPDGAFRWFEIAARSRKPEALNMLGRCYERGWGVAVDFERAAACYRDAAEKSYDWAQFNLACLMLDGKGVARDPDAAFDLLMRAATQGHVKSFNLIGCCHEHGWGCPADIATAIQWYHRGAEGGDFRGQYRYGQMLLERGMVEDGLSWLRRAIDNAPVEFCRHLAGDLLSHAEPGIRALGARAKARVEARAETPTETHADAVCG